LAGVGGGGVAEKQAKKARWGTRISCIQNNFTHELGGI
jgi:hypothetical protein